MCGGYLNNLETPATVLLRGQRRRATVYLIPSFTFVLGYENGSEFSNDRAVKSLRQSASSPSM
jgi:hypothetical protein